MVPKRPWPSPARMLGLSYKEHVEDNSENYAFTTMYMFSIFRWCENHRYLYQYKGTCQAIAMLKSVFCVFSNNKWHFLTKQLFDTIWQLTLNGNPTLVKKTVLILISIRCKLVDLCPKKFDEFIFISMAQIIWSRGRPVELLLDVH